MEVKLCYINDTLNGTNYEQFETQCKNNATLKNKNGTKWVLVSTSIKNSDEDLDVLKTVSNETKSQVAGIIFISRVYPRQLDSRISNETNKFISPPIMSIINNLHADTFANYSWNTMNATITPSNDTDGTDPVVVTNYTFEY